MLFGKKPTSPSVAASPPTGTSGAPEPETTTRAASEAAPAEPNGEKSALSAEQIAEIKRRATKSKLLQAAFGEIVGLLMRTPQFKNMPLSSLEDLVVPAITTGQFMVAEAQVKKSGFITPVAAVLWASVSEEIDRRLSESRDQPVRLAPKDWKSGDIPWLIIAAGDPRLIKAMQQRIQETVLKGRQLKSRPAETDHKPAAAATRLN